MPTDIKVFRPSDFVHARPDGTVNLGKTRQVLAELAAATADLDRCQILLDARRLKGALDPNEIWSLAQELLKYRKTFANRTALLCQFEKLERAKFFALCAESGGFNIQVFTSYEEAMEWLLGPDQS